MRFKIPDMEERTTHSIHIGGIHASRNPSVVRTVLGSCIAVCLRDPLTTVGGMNHFMLPDGQSDIAVSARYGVHAMELLINACMRLGASRSRLEAKIFGGGHVLRIAENANGVPQANIRFALDFLEMEGIPIRSQDVGGYHAREVYFYTDTGRILLKRLGCTHEAEEIARQECARLRAMTTGKQAKQDEEQDEEEDNVTLF